MMPLIPVIAFGTRGDIWPVISILYQLIHENTFVSSIKFVFITHNCFVSECALHLNSSYVEVLGMNSSPIVVTGADKFESNYANLLQERFNGSEVALVLSNLFALDSWLLAVQWRVRCVYIHPNCPYPDKGSRDVVLNTLKVQHSCLHQYLQKKSTPDHLQWTDYNEFLWPTLVSEYMDSQHAAIESEFASNELILGPIVLLLTSPRFAPPPSLLEGGTRTWLPRYHTCGFINYRSMYKQQEFKLEPHIFGVASSDGCISNATSAGACHNSCLCRLIRTTAELLVDLSNGDADNTLPLVCVDFGSMTQVLVEQDRLRHILLVIKHLMQYWRFVVVCHGYSAHIIRILEASPRSAEMTGISDQSSSSSNILLIEHSLDHCAVFPKCVTVIHHGGIGTVGTCLHCGVPQLILAVMYDQMSNGARVEELQLGECLNYDCLNYSSLEDNSGTLEPRGCLLFVGAAKVVDGAIRRCSAPPRRLRCACYGRDLRADPAEDGLVNALAVLQKLLRPYLISPEGNRTGGNVACAALDAATSLIADVLFVEDTMLQGMDYVLNEHNRLVLPNGMEVYSHFESASEETAFLYEEIFVHKVYQAAVEALQPGDLVVDVGANIGMFSLFASRTLRSSVNSDNICKPLRLLAVEPIRANFDLLVQNAQYYNWDCTAYHCAISTPTVLHSKEEECRENTSGKEVVSMVDVRCCQGGTNQPRQIPAVSTKEMRYYPRFPGNSCSADKAAVNLATQAQVMNPVVLESARVSAVAECSPVLSLSAVLEDYWGNCECTGDRDDLHACHLPPSSRLQQDASPGLKTASNIVCTRKRTVGGAFEAAPSLDDIQQPQQPQQQAQQLRQVALLKVDVEGDELEVLWSLRAVHWACIDRVIVEAALHLQHPIIDLLIYSGFPRDAISTDGGVPGSYTGNVIIFASKFT